MDGERGRGSEAEVNGVSLDPEGTEETQILFSLCISPPGRKKKKKSNMNIKERNHH